MPKGGPAPIYSSRTDTMCQKGSDVYYPLTKSILLKQADLLQDKVYFAGTIIHKWVPAHALF